MDQLNNEVDNEKGKVTPKKAETTNGSRMSIHLPIINLKSIENTPNEPNKDKYKNKIVAKLNANTKSYKQFDKNLKVANS